MPVTKRVETVVEFLDVVLGLRAPGDTRPYFRGLNRPGITGDLVD